ncbi:MAG: hypothetical protein HN952_04565 [Candidatus Cloacimonetes bacterium]|nr:hypothetical protein [Candidatus Cloacimonadota bacterium]MBT6994212.1 hypothetical protein [Candidatus Cloacimonadota bacterium]MBT7469204.1 hypothetical protein [Candidatus Cloacimonadota bacterium]
MSNYCKLGTLFFVLMLNVLACANSKESAESVIFNVDSLLIDEVFIDNEINVSFHPPINWTKLPKEQFQIIAEKISTLDSLEIEVILKQIFVSKEEQNVCVISNIVKDDVLIIAQYVDLLRNQHEILQELDFAYNGFLFKQISINNDEKIMLKFLIYNDNKIFMIDYLLKTNLYPNQVRAIESSIGSLSKINKEEI